jgi:hypothetical protein
MVVLWCFREDSPFVAPQSRPESESTSVILPMAAAPLVQTTVAKNSASNARGGFPLDGPSPVGLASYTVRRTGFKTRS